MLVDAIMNTKVVTVSRDHTVLKAAKLMRDRDVGSVVVVDDRKRPVGFLTDRDVCVKSVALGLSPDTPVDEIMSTPVHAIPENTLIFDLLRQMADRHVHRVPVINRYKKLVGIVSVDDAMLLLTTELSNVAEVLSQSSKFGH